MTVKITTLLLPLDGSPVAEVALPYAQTIAQACGAAVQLLAVLEREPRGLARSEERARRLEQQEQQALEATLAAAAAQLQSQGLTVTTRLGRGDPAATILAAAADESVTMVVMGTHGRGGADRGAVGSVADRVMRLNTKPTLLARLPYTAATPHAPRRRVVLQRLLVPLDGSAPAEAALPYAIELARASGAQLTLIRVEPWQTVGSAPAGTLREFAEMEDEAATDATDYLAAVRARLAADQVVDTIVVRGRPATCLVDFARYEHIDLIVMTTHGRGGLRRLVLGSVADQVVRDGVPTLLIAPPATASAGEAAAVWTTAPPPRTARDIMAQPVVTVAEDATLETVARLMQVRGIGSILVVDARGALRGIITETDFTAKEVGVPFSVYRAPQLFGEWLSKDHLDEAYARGRRLTAGQIMSTPAHTVTEDAPLMAVVEQMLRYDITRVPVVRDGVPVGVVARHDLLRLMVSDATQYST